MGFAAIVGMVVHVGMVVEMPTRTVDVIVVGVVVGNGSWSPYKGIVAGHRPCEYRPRMGTAEPQVLGGAVDCFVAHQPDAFHVNRHIDFFTGIGIVAIEPDFVVRRRDLFGPDFVDKYVGGQFILIAAVNHQFVLIVEERDRSQSLVVGEVQCVGGSGGHHRQCHCQHQDNLFHDKLF